MSNNKHVKRETLTILYLKCPICKEPSHFNQWSTGCFDSPTYQCSVSKEQPLNEDKYFICPKCLRSSMYGVLMQMQ